MTVSAAISLIEPQTSVSDISSFSTNHDIYDKRQTLPNPSPSFAHVPCCVYFFYVRVDGSGKIRIDHYFYNDGPDPANPKPWSPIPHGDMPAIVRHLALNARPTGTKQPPELPDHNFANVKFNRISYFAIFLDEVHWIFQRSAQNKVAISFNTSKGGVSNHSFFDAVDLDVVMPNRRAGQDDTRTAVYMINHMKKNSDGDELIGDEDFFFDMYFSVNFADPSAMPMTVILDPGGTNVGPPAQPGP